MVIMLDIAKLPSGIVYQLEFYQGKTVHSLTSLSKSVVEQMDLCLSDRRESTSVQFTFAFLSI